jgi:PTS hybrid protein
MVSLVLVAHSQRLLDALVEMVREMVAGAPACHVAGGTDDGRIGTSLDRVSSALRDAGRGSGTVVLYDSGSAWLTIAFAMDALAPGARARVVVSDAPLVEGTLVAAARAAQGAPLAEVVEAAESALFTEKRPLQSAANGGSGA